jgi:hypothetical protein
MGGTSGGGTVHSPEITRQVVLVEERVGSSTFTKTTHRVISKEWAVPPPLVAPVVLLLTSGQFLLH